MNGNRFQRWAPVSGILFVACMVITFGLSGSSPDTDTSDAKINAYLGSTTKYNNYVTAFFFLWAASLLFLGFWAALRTQLRVAEGRNGGMSALTFGAGVAATVFNAIGVTTFFSAIFAAHDAKHSHASLDASSYRLAQDLGYPVWIMTGIISALALWGTAAVVWRTRIWGRWYAVVSIIIGILGLASITFWPMALFGLWVLLTSILMIAKPTTRVTAAHTAPAPAMANDTAALSGTA